MSPRVCAPRQPGRIARVAGGEVPPHQVDEARAEHHGEARLHLDLAVVGREAAHQHAIGLAIMRVWRPVGAAGDRIQLQRGVARLVGEAPAGGDERLGLADDGTAPPGRNRHIARAAKAAGSGKARADCHGQARFGHGSGEGFAPALRRTARRQALHLVPEGLALAALAHHRLAQPAIGALDDDGLRVIEAFRYPSSRTRQTAFAPRGLSWPARTGWSRGARDRPHRACAPPRRNR